MSKASIWRVKVVNWIPEVQVIALPDADMGTVEKAARAAIAILAADGDEETHGEYAAKQSQAPLAVLERVGECYVDARFLAEAVKT